MQTHLSTQKIVIFLVFLCAAIMTSVFVFHLRHAPTKTLLASDEALIFPIARDIKAFELIQANHQPFTQQQFLNHWTLLFFGFTHCSKICPTTLDMLMRAYQPLHAAYPTLQVVFISLDPERDSLSQLSRYTRSFHPDFISATGKTQQLRQLQSQLGVFSARADGESTTTYQIQHTASIMLINPQGKWVGLFKYGLSPTEFIPLFQASMQSIDASHVSAS